MNAETTPEPVPRKTHDKLGTPVAILVRVSTSKQETDRQVTELQAHAAAKGYRVIEVCEECVSGNVSESGREGLQRVLSLARSGKIKKVLVHEVSRLARRNSVAHRFLEELDDCGVSLYRRRQGIETLLPSGKRNPAASIMFALLAEMARAERETLRSRIKSGMAEAARKGRFPGRPEGSGKTGEAMLKEYAPVVRQLGAGQSIRNTAAICKVSKNTVQKVRAAAVAGGVL
jgi:DNA invertase Pin-like site-specific DNA recombinase